jgi:hypothetical protein
VQIMCDISTSSAVTQPEISKNKWSNWSEIAGLCIPQANVSVIHDMPNWEERSFIQEDTTAATKGANCYNAEREALYPWM